MGVEVDGGGGGDGGVFDLVESEVGGLVGGGHGAGLLERLEGVLLPLCWDGYGCR